MVVSNPPWQYNKRQTKAEEKKVSRFYLKVQSKLIILVSLFWPNIKREIKIKTSIYFSLEKIQILKMDRRANLYQLFWHSLNQKDHVFKILFPLKSPTSYPGLNQTWVETQVMEEVLKEVWQKDMLRVQNGDLTSKSQIFSNTS